MATECISSYLDFPMLGSREVLADFDGGDISSDGGALLLRETERLTGIIRQFAACFTDHRNPDLTEHTVEELIAQRVYALRWATRTSTTTTISAATRCLPSSSANAIPPATRQRSRDRGKSLAGKSTLNRLEFTPVGADKDSRYKKIVCRTHDVEQLFVTLFLQAHTRSAERIVLDLDATDDPIHGHQLGRFFHGYYKNFCYLPLYIFCGDHLLCARLRPSDIDACAGVGQASQADRGTDPPGWPQVQIVIRRGDSGFCREEILHWCEEQRRGLRHRVGQEPAVGRVDRGGVGTGPQQFETTKQPARFFAELRYQHARDLEQGASRCGQGRAPGEGTEPAVRGHVAGGGRSCGEGII